VRNYRVLNGKQTITLFHVSLINLDSYKPQSWTVVIQAKLCAQRSADQKTKELNEEKDVRTSFDCERYVWTHVCVSNGKSATFRSQRTTTDSIIPVSTCTGLEISPIPTWIKSTKCNAHFSIIFNIRPWIAVQFNQWRYGLSKKYEIRAAWTIYRCTAATSGHQTFLRGIIMAVRLPCSLGTHERCRVQ
jgi:hypothetical protein